MQPIRTTKLEIRHILQTLLCIALALAALWYVSYQARNLLTGPEIALSSEPAVVQHEPTVHIEGMAHNITALTVNGSPIFTDEEGRFKKKLVLENGYTIMTIEATDRFGRKESLTRHFVYTPNS